MSLELKWEPIPNQKKEMGRAIDIVKCSQCTNKPCDYMNCRNYAVKTRMHKYTLNEWVDAFKGEIQQGWNDSIVDSFFEYAAPRFPKGLYWDRTKSLFNDTITSIRFVTMTRSGKEKVVGTIDMKKYDVTDFDLTITQEKHLNKIATMFEKIEEIKAS